MWFTKVSPRLSAATGSAWVDSQGERRRDEAGHEAGSYSPGSGHQGAWLGDTALVLESSLPWQEYLDWKWVGSVRPVSPFSHSSLMTCDSV